MIKNQIPENVCATDIPRISWKGMTDNQVKMTLLGATVKGNKAVIQRARRELRRRKI